MLNWLRTTFVIVACGRKSNIFGSEGLGIRSEPGEFYEITYDAGMGIRRTSHAVYDTRYPLVWAPKYRKWVLKGDLRVFMEECFNEIAKSNEFEIDALEIAKDHVHLFLGFPPRYSIADVVQRLKGGSAREVFKRYPEEKEELWGGAFWEDGYFVRTVGDKVTKDIIRKYIRYHKEQEKSPIKQLELF